MKQNPHRVYRPLMALGVALLLAAVSAPALSAHAQATTQTITTRYFTIRYPDEGADLAKWLSGFADEQNATLSLLLGAQPPGELRLTIYSDLSQLYALNPNSWVTGLRISGAYMVINSQSIGVILDQARSQSAQVRTDFRSAMAGLLALSLSNYGLPVGFREGFQRFFDLSPDGAKPFAATLKEQLDAKIPLWSWDDLNTESKMSKNLEVSVPQVYSAIAFLVENFPLAAMGHFMQLLHDRDQSADYPAFLPPAFGKSMADLEAQWRAWAPGWANSGGGTNPFAAADLSPGHDLYTTGNFAAAASYFAASEQLYGKLAHPTQVATAAGFRQQAEQARDAADSARKARAALEAHDYDTAVNAAEPAATAFATLQLTDRQQQAEATAALARSGLQGLALLGQAQQELDPVSVLNGQAAHDAQAAGELLASVGDAPRVAQANDLLAQAWRMIWLSALALLLLALLLLLIAAVAATRVLRAARVRPPRLGGQPQWWM